MMNYVQLLALLLGLLPLAQLQAQTTPPDPIELPENPRVRGMGGAYVAIAEDPQAGFRNPAALRNLPGIGMDFSYEQMTGGTRDRLAYSLSNPGTERGTAFAAGIWVDGLGLQGANHRLTYYVPYSGTSYDITETTHLGAVLRFPYRSTNLPGVESRWAMLADLSVLQTVGPARIGAAIERAVGGYREFAVRRLRIGGAYVYRERLIATYEWQADETADTYDFHYRSTHTGFEALIGDFVAARAGYIAGDRDRISVGGALGNLEQGWRLETAWELPVRGSGATRWSAGMGYRLQ